ncbi:hypothetical protein GUJ93_ZPchr0001g29835 [Zizania palustris]|uniref:Uncharacterized protein n=1 Tax=Zizania palustris TaxID=103762 RepID=A0A8J5R8F3_ZIZPA|nr:hypothetical protein GUJ93_ZPchr0001g29835 [Zizania palustris]
MSSIAVEARTHRGGCLLQPRLPGTLTTASIANSQSMAEEHEMRPRSSGRAEDPDEREEGEVADDDSAHVPPQPNQAAPHPLEHAWTFWFDNP